MLYITNNPIVYLGSRFERGATIDMTEVEAARIGADVSPFGETSVPTPEPEPEVTIEEMSVEQLKAKAKELGLKTSGSRADLVERITLSKEEELSN